MALTLIATFIRSGRPMLRFKLGVKKILLKKPQLDIELVMVTVGTWKTTRYRSFIWTSWGLLPPVHSINWNTRAPSSTTVRKKERSRPYRR